ncbi:MAG: plasmid stabilization protein [Salinimicrobium sp.]
MTVSYNRTFKKDLEKLKDAGTKAAIRKKILELKEKKDLNQVSGVKKISGHPLACRIRIGNYRLRLFYSDGNASLQRFVKRNDIYKVFP